MRIRLDTAGVTDAGQAIPGVTNDDVQTPVVLDEQRCLLTCSNQMDNSNGHFPTLDSIGHTFLDVFLGAESPVDSDL